MAGKEEEEDDAQNLEVKERKRRRKEEKKKKKKHKKEEDNTVEKAASTVAIEEDSQEEKKESKKHRKEKKEKKRSKKEKPSVGKEKEKADNCQEEKKEEVDSKEDAPSKKHAKEKKRRKKEKRRRNLLEDGEKPTKKPKTVETEASADKEKYSYQISPRAVKEQQLREVFQKQKAKRKAEQKEIMEKENPPDSDDANKDPRIVESSALEFGPDQESQTNNGVTLLLFYQYVEPIWSLEKYQQVLQEMDALGKSLQLTGRMRVAREGLNCTLTSTSRSLMLQFCRTMRQHPEFRTTEFKLTHDLPQAQRFKDFKVIPVIELVHYGLEGEKAPPIQNYHGVHLEPKDYHQKMAESNTVMIDVRNHYEAMIGHFQPPHKDAWLDPQMRKSTEFPVWLDKPETKQKLKGKQVLMYCTGGIRCERATSLLKYKMENDPEIKNLGIQEVYQLQGGIDKYFKQFPDGGFWEGKNYTFDKRFAHKPPAVEGQEKRGEVKPQQPMSRCEACQKPWDRFRGKRRCPTCGVPSLVCKECFDSKGKAKLRDVRCDLCVAQNITSRHKLRTKEQMELEEYEQKLVDRGLIPQPKKAKGERLKVTSSKGNNFKEVPHNNPKTKAPSNPNGVTRLYLKNMCRTSMDETTLMEFLPGITHIVWKQQKGGEFLGQGWVEMATPEEAALAVAKNGQRVLHRPLYINYQPPDSKDLWPPANSKV